MHQKQKYINRKCVSTHSERVFLSNIWYKSNTNNFSICHRGVWIFLMISIWFQRSVYVILSIWEGKWAPRPMDYTACFILIPSGFVRMLGVSCVVCNDFLFPHYSNNLNLIFAYYTNVTSWCVLSETTNVVVNGSLYKFWFYGLRVHFGFFLTPSVVDIQLLT